jgi:hypothetical protein
MDDMETFIEDAERQAERERDGKFDEEEGNEEGGFDDEEETGQTCKVYPTYLNNSRR